MTGRRVVTDDVGVLQRAFAAEFTEKAAEIIARRGRFVVALPGGSVATTFLPVLAGLAVDWAHIDLFWIDERAVPPDHPDSNYGIASRLLLAPARVPLARIHRMQGELPELEQAARRASDELRSVAGDPPRLDLALVGVGADGHVASIFGGVSEDGRRTNADPVIAVHDAPKPPREAAHDDAARSCQCRDRCRRRIRRFESRGDARRDRPTRSDTGCKAPSRRVIIARAPRSRSGTIIGAYFSWRRVSCVRCFSP